MTPLILGLGMPELLIILAVVLLLFGGSRLAGLGRSSGRAIREFKEETRDIKAADKDKDATGEAPKQIERPVDRPIGKTEQAGEPIRNPEDLR